MSAMLHIQALSASVFSGNFGWSSTSIPSKWPCRSAVLAVRPGDLQGLPVNPSGRYIEAFFAGCVAHISAHVVVGLCHRSVLLIQWLRIGFECCLLVCGHEPPLGCQIDGAWSVLIDAAYFAATLLLWLLVLRSGLIRHPWVWGSGLPLIGGAPRVLAAWCLGPTRWPGATTWGLLWVPRLTWRLEQTHALRSPIATFA